MHVQKPVNASILNYIQSHHQMIKKKMVQISIELNNIPILVETDENAEMTKPAHLVATENFAQNL